MPALDAVTLKAMQADDGWRLLVVGVAVNHTCLSVRISNGCYQRIFL